MAPRDWRNEADYAGLQSLDAASLAWEFLRRNPQFAAEAAAGGNETRLARWGLLFPADPRLRAAEAAVFWRPDLAPAHVVALVRAERGAAASAVAAVSEAERVAEGEVHVRLPAGLQAVLPAGLAPEAPLGVLAPMDAHFPARLAAAAALGRILAERPPLPDSRSALSRTRAVRMVRALDARAQGASYREVAAGVLGGAPPGLAWRTASVRDVAVRLCRAARRMTQGGYLALLRRSR